MKRFYIVLLLTSLIIGSLATGKTASASGIYPYSEGCTWQITGSGQQSLNKNFYDHDIIHITSNVMVNVSIIGNGVNYQTTSLSVNFDIPHTGSYTVNIMPIVPVGVTPQWVYGCTPTPISGACIVSNANFTASITISGVYNAGERIKFVADNYMSVKITGMVTSSTWQTKNYPFVIPITGNYTFTVTQAARGTLNGTVTCTLPR